MKIKINQVLKDAKNDNLVYQDTKEPITLAEVIKDSMLIPKKDEDSKSKYNRYEFFKRVMDCLKQGKSAELELTSEEVAEIKKHIGEFKPQPLIMGQAWDMLEGKLETEIMNPNLNQKIPKSKKSD